MTKTERKKEENEENWKKNLSKSLLTSAMNRRIRQIDASKSLAEDIVLYFLERERKAE